MQPLFVNKTSVGRFPGILLSFAILTLGIAIGSSFRIPWLVENNITFQSKPEVAVTASATPAQVATSADKSSSPSIPVSRPYGDFCSVNVINEQQLWNQQKKVISYSLFVLTDQESKRSVNAKRRNFDTYVNGFEANVKGAALYYPEWIVRVFTFDLSPEQIKSLIEIDPSRVEVVECNSSTPIGNKWPTKAFTRLFPYDDPSVHTFISRDTDGRFSARELLAVNQWLASGDHCFHAMRDHPAHRVAVMAGMFGMKQGCLGGDGVGIMTFLRQELKRDPNLGAPHFDQSFLAKYVWPRVKNRTISHDIDKARCDGHGAAFCADWPLGSARAYENRTYYVGQPRRNEEYSSGYFCTLEC